MIRNIKINLTNDNFTKIGEKSDERIIIWGKEKSKIACRNLG